MKWRGLIALQRPSRGSSDFSLTGEVVTITDAMLTEIEVRDFRCFQRARVDLHPRMTILMGRNAQGKTSLLEAACVLLRLQSPRTSARAELIRFEAGNYVIEGKWSGHSLRHAASVSRRRLALDGVVCGRGVDYLAHSGLVVWMDHADMNLVRGSSEHRRRFLDFAASQTAPDYLQALQGYNRALRARNYVLKRELMINWRQADAYARLMDSFHSTLTNARRQLLYDLQPVASTVMTELSQHCEEVQIAYQPGCVESTLFDELASRRDEEARTRTTATGAHRDDFAVSLNGRPADAFASEGQQRSIAISLKLAQARTLETVRGAAPLLLIDDIFGELDPVRRRAFLAALPPDAQAIITTTHLDWASGMPEAWVYHVEGAAPARVASE